VRDFLRTMDIEFTMPDKKSEATPFLSIDKTDFLKRRSIKTEAIGGYYVGALDVDSIWKSLFCYRKNTNHEEVNIMYGIVTSALVEFFYHGKEVFEFNKNVLGEAMKGTTLVIKNWDLMTYEALANKWMDTYCPKRIAANLKAAQRAPVVGSTPDNVVNIEELDLSM